MKIAGGRILIEQTYPGARGGDLILYLLLNELLFSMSMALNQHSFFFAIPGSTADLTFSTPALKTLARKRRNIRRVAFTLSPEDFRPLSPAGG